MSATRLEPDALVADVGAGAAAAVAWALARGCGRTESFGRARSGGAATALVATGDGAAAIRAATGAAGEHGTVTSVVAAAAAAAATWSAGSGDSQALGRDGDAGGDWTVWLAAAAGESRCCCCTGEPRGMHCPAGGAANARSAGERGMPRPTRGGASSTGGRRVLRVARPGDVALPVDCGAGTASASVATEATWGERGSVRCGANASTGERGRLFCGTNTATGERGRHLPRLGTAAAAASKSSAAAQVTTVTVGECNVEAVAAIRPRRRRVDRGVT